MLYREELSMSTLFRGLKDSYGMAVWSIINSRLGSTLCLDYGNKIVNQKLLGGEEKKVLVSLYVIQSF